MCHLLRQLVALAALISHGASQSQRLETITLYEEASTCNSSTDYVSSVWSVIDSKLLSPTVMCQQMLERDYAVWYKSTVTCGDTSITSKAEWCDLEDCTSCDSQDDSGTIFPVTYTWTTLNYLAMQVGLCADVSITSAETRRSDDDDVVWKTTSARFQITGTKNLANNAWPCSYLSSAPTTVPTKAPTTAPTPITPSPTSAPTELSFIEIVLIAVGGTLLVVGALAAVYFRRLWLRNHQIEPWRTEMHRAARAKCNGDAKWAQERVESEGLGVSAAYLITEFLAESQAAARLGKDMDPPVGRKRRVCEDINNPRFYDISRVMCYGETAKGYGVVCPRDREQNCSVVDTLHKEGKAAQATQFLSWVWCYKAKMFTRTIKGWVQYEKLVPEDTFIWVCFFCNNQFRLNSSNSDDLEKVFETRLRSAGSLIAMLDTWDKPVYLTRCWTIFEQYIGHELAVGVTIILPPEVMGSFTAEMEAGNIKQIKDNLTELDVENAKASVLEDELKVKQLISSTVGFDAVNLSVKRSMQTWCASVLKAYLEGCLQSLQQDNEDPLADDSGTNDLHKMAPDQAVSAPSIRAMSSVFSLCGRVTKHRLSRITDPLTAAKYVVDEVPAEPQRKESASVVPMDSEISMNDQVLE